MSEYQLAIKQFVRYAPADARVYVGRSMVREITELMDVYTKPLYKGGEPDKQAALLELSDIRFNLAEACTLIGLDLDSLQPHTGLPAVYCHDDRFARLVLHAEKVWYGLRRHYKAEWLEHQLRMLLTDLEWARVELLDTTWAEIEAANVAKLTARQAQQAATA
jgi:hypothetical protein